MTEHTDKASRKSGKASPKGRPGKSRSPKGKRAKAPHSQKPNPEAATDKAAAPAAPATKAPDAKPPGPSPLAPDPATISFGSNRPIAAAPHKLPEGSGLRFSGPSAGELKASGPQPTSAKAGGLTFTNAKSSATLAKPIGAKPIGAKPIGAKPNGTGRPEIKRPEIKRPEARKPEAAGTPGPKAEDGKQNAKTPETSKIPASGAKAPVKAPVLTKPAIAPQASGRRLEKERSYSGFVMTLLGLVVAVGALAFWLNPGEDPAAPGAEVAAVQPVPEAAPESGIATVPAPQTLGPQTFGPSVRAPESPGPLAASEPVDSIEHTTDLSLEEIGEVQRLLDRLGLPPGNTDGILTANTEAAIRSYQEMAGLPANGTADGTLLEELRSVAELYDS